MQQAVVFITLTLIVFLFIWDKIRYDFVALAALFTIVIAGIIPVNTAFNGFSNPAVVTVVAVMIISKGMQYCGLLDALSRHLNWFGKKPTSLIFPLSVFTALASSFMNNVSIVIPVSIKLAKKRHHSPSLILMPLAFATLLGGMTTLVGSSPNIIVSSVRAETINEPFRMFDFLPIGIILSILGILYTSLIGWRFLPKRESPISMQDTLEIEDYYTEVQVSEESKLVGLSLKQLVDSESYEIDLVGVVRNGNYLNALNLNVTIQSEDVLMIKADSKHLQSFVDVSGTKILVESDTHTKPVINKDNTLIEVVVMKESPLVGKSVAQMRLLEDYGIDLLAKTGGRKAKTKRLSYQVIKMGDVLLIQGNANRIAGEITNLGCLALTEREQKIGDERKISVYLMIVIAGIASVILRLLPVHIAFPLSALLLVLSGVIPYREVYKAVDWSVIVMLGAMIPFGRAMIISGGADTISNALLYLGQYSAQWLLVGLLLLLTMLLTNLVNNATTSIVMAPIAIELARSLGTSPDLYLMTVAVGACSVFLSPIGHQANTLVMGPGGYRFGDYWRVGLGLQIIVLVSAIPLLLYYWG